MPRVLVAEPSAPISAALRKFLASEAEVKVVHFLDEAVQEVRAGYNDFATAVTKAAMRMISTTDPTARVLADLQRELERAVPIK